MVRGTDRGRGGHDAVGHLHRAGERKRGHTGGRHDSVERQRAVDLAGNVMTDDTVPSADLGSAGIEVDTTDPANLSGMDVVYDNGVNSGGDDNPTNDPAVTTTLVGQGVDINEVAETSTTTYYALSDAGAGTSGWVTDPADRLFP